MIDYKSATIITVIGVTSIIQKWLQVQGTNGRISRTSILLYSVWCREERKGADVLYSFIYIYIYYKYVLLPVATKMGDGRMGWTLSEHSKGKAEMPLQVLKSLEVNLRAMEQQMNQAVGDKWQSLGIAQ